MIHGKSIGFRDLDQRTLLLQESSLIGIGARPSVGKTALALTILSHWLDNDLPVALFSLEMGPHQILERLVSIRTGISGEKIERGDLSDQEMEEIKKCIENLLQKNLVIQDQGCASIEKICMQARRLKEKYNIGLIIIDYVQLIVSERSSGSRQYEVGSISRELKLLAMELKIPIICLAQLSRKVEERPGHMPILSDLRDSGQIEQDCDVVLFIHRRDVYDRFDKPGIADLIVGKNRHGPTLTVSLGFDAPTGKFSDLPPLQAANLQLGSPPQTIDNPPKISKKSQPRKKETFDESDDSNYEDD
jgi:Replicative DNA helicase